MRLLDAIIIILIIMWLGGFTLHMAGSLIHILLVMAVIVFVIRILS